MKAARKCLTISIHERSLLSHKDGHRPINAVAVEKERDELALAVRLGGEGGLWQRQMTRDGLGMVGKWGCGRHS